LGPISAMDNTPAPGASEIWSVAGIAQLLLPIACNTAKFNPKTVKRSEPF
jgi:hypothetical protein